MSSLDQYSEELADAVEAAGNSVLRLRARRRPASAIVWKDGEHAVTVAHAVMRHDDGEVELPDGSFRKATVVGRDPSCDLALLKIEGGGLVPADWDEATPRVGNLALIVARSAGGARATLGLVSAVGDAWRSATGGDLSAWLDVDATLPRGGSGGPLVSTTGKVVGLNTHGLVRGGTTVPTITVERAVERILEGGDVKRGWLGVGVHPGKLSDALAETAGQEVALLVTSVAKESPAEEAGVLTGDALLALEGNKLARYEDLVAALASLGGRKSALELLRGGEKLTVEVTPTERKHRGC
jgi:S1-C subfamily serine protease